MGGRGPCRAVIRLLPLGCALLLAPSPTSGFVLFSPWGKIEQGDEYRTDPYISKDGALTWQGPQSFELYETVFLWSWPESELDHSGLGGGITWALHPDFCSKMLPLFPEDGHRRGGIDGCALQATTPASKAPSPKLLLRTT